MKEITEKQQLLSKALGDIHTCYIQEADHYTATTNPQRPNSQAEKKKHTRKANVFRLAIAAGFAVCLLAGSIRFFSWLSPEEFLVKAYSYETGEEITATGVVMDTGSINDTGEQKGHPLMFYLTGEGIEQVRFSCEKQFLSFLDWTEQRDEYALVQNFTVPYGEHTDEYDYLTIDWEPEEILKAIREGSTIAALPEELKEDRIIMEITFSDGTTAIKSIQISLLEDGTFFAVFDDDTIREQDTFVRRKDDLSLREASEQKLAHLKQLQEEEKKDNTSEDKKPSPSDEAIKAAQAAARQTALKYYEKTVFEVVSLDVTSAEEKKVVFSVCVKKGGILQEPNRMIILEKTGDEWEVTGEGY